MNLAVFTLIDLRRIFVDWAGLFFTTGRLAENPTELQSRGLISYAVIS